MTFNFESITQYNTQNDNQYNSTDTEINLYSRMQLIYTLELRTPRLLLH